MSFPLPKNPIPRSCSKCGIDIGIVNRRGGVHYCDKCRCEAKAEARSAKSIRARASCDRSRPQPFPVWMWDYLCNDRPDLSLATRRRNLMYLQSYGV